MKIIQIIPDLNLAGGQIMCENLSCELQKLGQEIKIISLYTTDSPIAQRLKENDVDIIFLDKKRGLDLSIISKLRRILKKEKPDVIHTHLNAFMYLRLALFGIRCGKVVHTFHSMANKESLAYLPEFIRRPIKKGKVTPVALSATVQQSIADMYGLDVHKIPVVLNGLDLSKCQIKMDYSIKNDYKILHIGRFSNEKNHIGLIKAFDILHSKYPNTRLCLIGEGSLKEEVEAYVNELGLSHCVDFMGKQGNVYPFLNDADVFVLPSIVEGIPITLIEAIGTGLPMVATKVGGVPDMITHNVTGLLCDVDVNQIAKCLETYYLDSNLRASHGTAALNSSGRFSSREMARGYLEIYQS